MSCTCDPSLNITWMLIHCTIPATLFRSNSPLQLSSTSKAFYVTSQLHIFRIFSFYARLAVRSQQFLFNYNCVDTFEITKVLILYTHWSKIHTLCVGGAEVLVGFLTRLVFMLLLLLFVSTVPSVSSSRVMIFFNQFSFTALWYCTYLMDVSNV